MDHLVPLAQIRFPPLHHRHGLERGLVPGLRRCRLGHALDPDTQEQAH
jgi:hypothetical protein